MKTLTTNQRDAGFTLLEVLVALFVLSLGLLGLAALQITSLSFNTDAYMRTQATVLVYDIIDKMKTNPTGVASGEYDVASVSIADTKVSTYDSCAGSTCKCDSSTAACNVANLALFDLGTWYKKMEEVLPDSKTNRALIIRDATTNVVTITISWVERDIPKQLNWEVQL